MNAIKVLNQQSELTSSRWDHLHHPVWFDLCASNEETIDRFQIVQDVGAVSINDLVVEQGQLLVMHLDRQLGSINDLRETLSQKEETERNSAFYIVSDQPIPRRVPFESLNRCRDVP